MSGYIITRHSERGHIALIDYDESPRDPREDDHLGSIIAWRNGEPLAEATGWKSLEDWISHELGRNPEIQTGVETPQRRNPTVDDLSGLALPIYISEHGQIRLSHAGHFGQYTMTPQCGYSYVSYQRLRRQQIISQGRANYQRARTILDAELEEYVRWLNGEMYRARIWPICDQCGVANLDNRPALVLGSLTDLDGAIAAAKDAIADLAAAA